MHVRNLGTALQIASQKHFPRLSGNFDSLYIRIFGIQFTLLNRYIYNRAYALTATRGLLHYPKTQNVINSGPQMA